MLSYIVVVPSVDIVHTRLGVFFLSTLDPKLFTRLLERLVVVESAVIPRDGGLSRLMQRLFGSLLEGPILIDIVLVIQRKKNDEVRLLSLLVPQDVSELM